MGVPLLSLHDTPLAIHVSGPGLSLNNLTVQQSL
jgi:hypothetical protein